jgi:LysR family transcriptional activator of nhaA
LLGESSLTVFGVRKFAVKLSKNFPSGLHKAPFLLPGEDVAARPKLLQWLDSNELRPNVIGEFDDSAMMAAFGQAGAGIFAAPTVIADHICEQYKVHAIGCIEPVVERLFAISTERKLTHPAILAISDAARADIFS